MREREREAVLHQCTDMIGLMLVDTLAQDGRSKTTDGILHADDLAIITDNNDR